MSYDVHKCLVLCAISNFFGMEVMHERNAHNFPLDLAAVEAPSTNG
jgi:hypothetical protein